MLRAASSWAKEFGVARANGTKLVRAVRGELSEEFIRLFLKNDHPTAGQLVRRLKKLAKDESR